MASHAAPRREIRPPRPARRGDLSPLVRLRRIALGASAIVLVPALISFLGAMTQTSNATFGIRAVEWLRDNGAASVVAEVESVYYSLTAPAKGGPALKALPHVGVAGGGAKAGAGTATGLPAEYRPPTVPALLHPALPGEGVWHATRPGLEASPPVLVTTIRNQPEYPRVVAGLAWIDMKRASVQLHPGRLEPSVELPRGPMEVPAEERPKLIATFNSAFKLADSGGGFAVGGHTYARMKTGLATIVGYDNGTVDVTEWHGGTLIGPGIAYARQNLPLIVDEGKPNPNLSNGAEWGATVGNAILVWRSAIGVDAHGNLIYAAGEDQTVSSLAHVLIRAGAVRAMELDINSFWVSFITYGSAGALDPKNLLAGMERPSTRYLEPDDRDFFTVTSR